MVTPEEVEATREEGSASLKRGAAVRERTRVRRNGPAGPLRERLGIWEWQFDNVNERERIREGVFAAVLQSGRGEAICHQCNDIFAAAELRGEEARWDGIVRLRFFCPATHLLFVTNEGVMGEMDGWDYDWRPLPRPFSWSVTDESNP
jgi:hypothetical protein